MARAFINLCGGAMVIDPFAGSGTALVEATVMGAPSFGVDIDLLSVAIAQAKAQLLSDDGAVAEAIADVLGRLDASDKGKELARLNQQESSKGARVWAAPAPLG
jgi:23S rRNA G2445 N2-methylase RlmL